MFLRAGFAQTDITPPVGSTKIGWFSGRTVDRILGPVYARCAVFENGDATAAFIQLDTLSVRWTQVNDIRQRIEFRYGFPGSNVMVSATHNHCGPAVANVLGAARDDVYIEHMVSAVVDMFGKAMKGLAPAEAGCGSCSEFRVGHNRRVVMRDGSVRTHGNFDDPDALFVEGPIDPEVAVLAVRQSDGLPMGMIVNFGCHPTHFGWNGSITAGYPGVLSREVNARGWPVTLFLNGAGGNVHTADPTRGGTDMSMEEAGLCLAEDVCGILEDMEYTRDVSLNSVSTTIRLPYRELTDDELSLQARGACHFPDADLHARLIAQTADKISRCNAKRAEVQALGVGERVFVGIPAEYFCENGLYIKEHAHPTHALIVGQANGMVGYVPQKEAFVRGGYETTLADSSCLAPEAGELLATAALDVIRRIQGGSDQG